MNPRERFLAALKGNMADHLPLTIQVHFPSSVHLFGVETIRDYAGMILKESKPGDRITIGTMEDVPDRGRNTLVPMYRFFRENGQLPLRVSSI